MAILAVAASWMLVAFQSCAASDPCDPNPCTEPHKRQCTPGGSAISATCSCDPGFDPDPSGLCVLTKLRYTALAAGGLHTCGLSTDGLILCWGSDRSGQLGDGLGSLDSEVPVPVDVSGIGPPVLFKALTSGAEHTCGLATDGRVFCWGEDRGQLGDGAEAPSTCGVSPCSRSPVQVDVSGISPPVVFKELTAGGYHTCGLATDGRAFCFGRNYSAQLGNGGNSLDSEVPVPVDVSGISPPVSFTALAAGKEHTCGLATDGRAFCFGNDLFGQLGNGGGASSTCEGHPCSLVPVLVDATGIRFAALTAGWEHTCGIATDGRAFCWGKDGYGQLGNGAGALGSCGAGSGTSSPCAESPVLVNGGIPFAALTAGGEHTCGIATDGRAFCWGRDKYSQLGNGAGSPSTCDDGLGNSSPCAESPVLVEGGTQFTALTAGGYHTCGIATDGRAFCFGGNFVGQLGNGVSADHSQVPALVDVNGINPPVVFEELSAGRNHTCGLAADGRAFCWGQDFYAQLGNGGVSQDSQVPVLVDVSGQSPKVLFTALAAGMEHTCGVASDGRAFCWGRDWLGELGNGGESVSSPVPVLVDVGGISPSVSFAALTAGNHNTCGLATDGRAFCWGGDYLGELGNGAGAPRTCDSGSGQNYACSESPVLVDVNGIAPSVTFTALTAEGEHACGLAADGRAFCWGWDNLGQLGNGNGAPNICDRYACSESPFLVDVSGISPSVSFKAITAGDRHTCGVALDGRAFCWGEDFTGQLGNGKGAPSTCHDGLGHSSPCSELPLPVEVVGVEFAALTAGGYHTCGLVADGRAFCWGYDGSGQLGSGAGAPGSCGTSADPCSESPVRVTGGIEFQALTAGREHTCGLASDGRAFCWGSDSYGQLGNGVGSDSAQVPVPVESFD